MIRFVVCTYIFLLTSIVCLPQSRTDLEATRKKTLEEISYVDNLLKTTAKQRNESLNTVKIINRKLTMRESVISGMKQEIDLLAERINLNNIAIEMMEQDLVSLKNDYSNAIVNSYKTSKANRKMLYVLSAKDFNQGYKRLKYLQQVSEIRRNETETIYELKAQIEDAMNRLRIDYNNISELKSKEEQQKGLLQKEQLRSQQLVKTLSSREKQLKTQLEEKKRTARKIESEIAKLIEEEKKKAKIEAQSPEQKLIGDNFAENKGRLPWPVDRGLITSHFGIQKNAVLKNIQEENIGIEITGTGKMTARSIFKGEVTRVFPIQGSNMTVIIRHGKYYSVYNNVVNVKVKPGENVDTKQVIGDVFINPADNNCVLEFMIYDTKFQDPELWIAKN